MNDSGITFQKGSKTNVGALIATTAKNFDDQALVKNYDLEKSGSVCFPAESCVGANGYYGYKFSGAEAAITNNGTITAADKGAVLLIAPKITNGPTGIIQANGSNTYPDYSTGNLRARGYVGLIGSSDASVAFDADGRAALVETGNGQTNTNSEVINNGKLISNDGSVEIIANTDTSVSNGKTVVNNTGNITSHSGYVKIFSMDNNSLADVAMNLDGVIDVNVIDAGGQPRRIETTPNTDLTIRAGKISVASQKDVNITGKMSADGDSGGGKVVVYSLNGNVNVANTANISASGYGGMGNNYYVDSSHTDGGYHDKFTDTGYYSSAYAVSGQAEIIRGGKYKDKATAKTYNSTSAGDINIDGKISTSALDNPSLPTKGVGGKIRVINNDGDININQSAELSSTSTTTPSRLVTITPDGKWVTPESDEYSDLHRSNISVEAHKTNGSELQPNITISGKIDVSGVKGGEGGTVYISNTTNDEGKPNDSYTNNGGEIKVTSTAQILARGSIDPTEYSWYNGQAVPKGTYFSGKSGDITFAYNNTDGAPKYINENGETQAITNAYVDLRSTKATPTQIHAKILGPSDSGMVEYQSLDLGDPTPAVQAKDALVAKAAADAKAIAEAKAAAYDKAIAKAIADNKAAADAKAIADAKKAADAKIAADAKAAADAKKAAADAKAIADAKATADAKKAADAKLAAEAKAIADAKAASDAKKAADAKLAADAKAIADAKATADAKKAADAKLAAEAKAIADAKAASDAKKAADAKLAADAKAAADAKKAAVSKPPVKLTKAQKKAAAAKLVAEKKAAAAKLAAK